MHLSSFNRVDVLGTIAVLVRRSELLCFFNTAEVLGIAHPTISLMDLAVLLGVFGTPTLLALDFCLLDFVDIYFDLLTSSASVCFCL